MLGSSMPRLFRGIFKMGTSGMIDLFIEGSFHSRSNLKWQIAKHFLLPHISLLLLHTDLAQYNSRVIQFAYSILLSSSDRISTLSTYYIIKLFKIYFLQITHQLILFFYFLCLEEGNNQVTDMPLLQNEERLYCLPNLEWIHH
jgi:hypothetical protein